MLCLWFGLTCLFWSGFGAVRFFFCRFLLSFCGTSTPTLCFSYLQDVAELVCGADEHVGWHGVKASEEREFFRVRYVLLSGTPISHNKLQPGKPMLPLPECCFLAALVSLPISFSPHKFSFLGVIFFCCNIFFVFFQLHFTIQLHTCRYKSVHIRKV